MKLERKLFLSFALLLLCLVAGFYFFADSVIGEDPKGAKLQIFLVVLLFLIAALLLTWGIVRKVVKPLRDLSLAAEKVKRGEYEEVRLPADSGGEDEIAFLSQSFALMVEGLKEREQIRSVLNKVVSKDIADEILKSNVRLGGEDRIVSILFSDIRNFTAMTESFSPQEVIGMLNAFMTKMTRLIEGEGGIIDKYIGDAIMALYGVPLPHPDHALRAISSAKIMMETLKKWNGEREAQGRKRIEIGIGVHTGMVVAGNMGAEDRMNYTVLGSGVNLAARLCESAKGGQILISEYTLNEPNIKDSFFVTSLAPLVVKGFSHPIKVYEVLGFKWESG